MYNIINIIMSNIIDRQTFVISTPLDILTGAIPSIVELPMNLRFAADELILKSISYANPNALASQDVMDVVQIWCNITNDGLIGSFPNSGPSAIPVVSNPNTHLRLSNSFQTGNFILQFQVTDGAPYFLNNASFNPQSLISSQVPQRTFGTVVLTVEFVKLKNKDIY